MNDDDDDDDDNNDRGASLALGGFRNGGVGFWVQYQCQCQERFPVRYLRYLR